VLKSVLDEGEDEDVDMKWSVKVGNERGIGKDGLRVRKESF